MDDWYNAIKFIAMSIAVISIIAFLRGFFEEAIKDRKFWKQAMKDIRAKWGKER
jgi:hypothetical protein